MTCSMRHLAALLPGVVAALLCVGAHAQVCTQGPPCGRSEIVETYAAGTPTGWFVGTSSGPQQPLGTVSSCGLLPPHVGGLGVLNNQQLFKTFTGIPTNHSALSVELQFVLIDSRPPADEMVQVTVGNRKPPLLATVFLSATVSKGMHMCGDPTAQDVGLVRLQVPEMAHAGSTLTISMNPTMPSNTYWGIAKAIITLDPSAQKGCNECSKPHMVCTRGAGRAGLVCGCQAGFHLSGNECIDNDECAVQGLVLQHNVAGHNPQQPTGWDYVVEQGRVNVLVTSCDGVDMVGGYNMLGRDMRVERTFRNLPGHTSMTVDLALYLIDSWDNETVTMYINGVEVAQHRQEFIRAAMGPSTCGFPHFSDRGVVVLSAHVPRHTASEFTVRVKSILDQTMYDESYGIVSTTITLGNDRCGLDATCTNTIGSFNCTCPPNLIARNGRDCVDPNSPTPTTTGTTSPTTTGTTSPTTSGTTTMVACPTFSGVTNNGLELTGCPEGHAVGNPTCTVTCASGIGTSAIWTCAANGAWVPSYPRCFEYNPKLQATAGGLYFGPAIRTNLSPDAIANAVVEVSTSNLHASDATPSANVPGSFGSITAFFSASADRTGRPPVRFQLNVSWDDAAFGRQSIPLPEFEVNVRPPLISSGSVQFAFTGQRFFGQKPGISGGSPPYSFQLRSGTLPSNFSINSEGIIVGTTSQVGTFDGVVVQATDVSGATLDLDPLNFQIVPALEVATNVTGLLPTAVETVGYRQAFSLTPTGGSGAVTYAADGLVPPGLAVDAQTGTIEGFPAPGSARPSPYTFDIVASDDSGIEAPVLAVSLLVEPKPDCDDPSNGPNGQGCGNGLCVDQVAFDGVFACDCTATGLAGDNCLIATTADNEDLLASRGATDMPSAVSGTIGTLVGLVLILLVVGLLVRRAQVRARNQPFDFQVELERMQDEGLISAVVLADQGDRKKRVPRELKRANVRLLDRLGAGQFGDVFKGTVDDSAETGVPEYLVAIKTLKGDPTSTEMTELMREAALMAQFRHRNVVNIVGVCTKGEPYFLVVQFCENGALNDYLKEQDGPLGGATVVRMAHDIATGMEYLAGAGLVHRDLAARNVLLDSHLVCKVADFGMSRDVATTDKEYYRAGTRGMLPIRWAAPEALEEQVFSQKTDVWAWGITVYEMLTGGAMPYDGWSNQKVWVNVKAGHRLECPEGFDEAWYKEVVLPCWHTEPADRPTFAQLAKSLEATSRQSVAQPLGSPRGCRASMDAVLSTPVPGFDAAPSHLYVDLAAAAEASLPGSVDASSSASLCGNGIGPPPPELEAPMAASVLVSRPSSVRSGTAASFRTHTVRGWLASETTPATSAAVSRPVSFRTTLRRPTPAPPCSDLGVDVDVDADAVLADAQRRLTQRRGTRTL